MVGIDVPGVAGDVGFAVTPYLLFFLMAGLPALFHLKNSGRALWAVVWLLFVLFIGLRHEVGGDWRGYTLITERIGQLSLQEALFDQELLFSLLTWVSASLGLGVYGVNFVGAVVFCTGLFAFCGRLPNRWLALTAATPFLVVVAVMSANRQGMAIGIVLYVMSRWQKWGVLKRSTGILLAGLFHTSAVLLLVLSVADMRISRAKKTILYIIAGTLGLWLASRSEEAWYRYTSIYVQQSAGAYSPGAIFHLLINLVPGAIMLWSKRRWELLSMWPLLRPLCWMAMALLVLSPFFTVAVGRMSLYLFPISIVFFTHLPSFVPGSGRALVRTVTVSFMGAVLAMWLQFANTAFTYYPYQNALFLNAWELELKR